MDKGTNMTGPVIFLDVDGVICTALSYRLTKLLRIDWLRQIFDPVSLFWLRRLTAKFGARIILTSTWRDALTMEDDWGKALISNLYGRMEQNGTPIAGATPVIYSGDRSTEIHAWLEDNPCDSYVIFDDHDRFREFPHVRRGLIMIEHSEGIRYPHYRTAVRLLSQNSNK